MANYNALAANTKADLAAPAVGQNELTLLGYTTIGDGGGGNFYWKAGNFSTMGDNGTIFPVGTTGAWFRLIDDVVNVRWFGAKGDGVTDDTDAIQLSIKYIAGTTPTNTTNPPQAGADEIPSRNFFEKTRTLIFSTGTYKVAKVASLPLLIPSGVILDGDHSTLLGAGNTTPGGTTPQFWSNGGTLFQSAYIDASGILKSNIGTTPGYERVIYTTVKNFVIKHYALGMNLYNCCEATRFENLIFTDCYQGWVMDQCYFSYVNNVYCRSGITDAQRPNLAIAAFVFQGGNNIVTINDISVSSRTIGFKFIDSINGMLITNLDAEFVDIGIQFTKSGGNPSINPLTITSCYFENIATAALSFESVTVINLELAGNWFYNNPIGTAVFCKFTSSAVYGGRIAANNTFYLDSSAIPQLISMDAFTQQFAFNFIIEPRSLEGVYLNVPTTYQSADLPTGYSNVGPGVDIEGYRTVYQDSNHKTPVFRGHYASSTYVVPKYYSGKNGYASNVVPYTTITTTTHGSGVFDLNIKTSIYYDLGMSVFLNLKITDNNGSYIFRGKILNDDIVLEGYPPFTLTISNVSGVLQLNILNLNHPTYQYTATGSIQIL